MIPFNAQKSVKFLHISKCRLVSFQKLINLQKRMFFDSGKQENKSAQWKCERF